MANYLKLLTLILTLTLLAGISATVSGQEPPPPPEVTVSFSPSEYTVSEGDGTVDISLILSQPVDSEVDVHWVPVFPGPHFRDTQGITTVTFIANTTSITFTVEWPDDLDNQKVESAPQTFWVHLLGSSNTSVSVDLSPAVVTVLDDDTSIGWKAAERGGFVVAENGTFERCVVLQGMSRDNLAVDIAHVDEDDALASVPPVPASVTFGTGETEKCFTLATSDVSGVSMASFELTGTNQDDDVSIVGLTESSVWVHDADSQVSFVQFERYSYIVNEGDGTATLSLEIDSAPPEPVSVVVRTRDGTARAPGDYTSLTSTVTFPANTTSPQTVEVPIVDSITINPLATQDFVVTLQSSDQRVAVGHSAATVSISDDDTVIVGLDRAYYFIVERNTPLSILATVFVPKVNCPSPPFTLQLTTSEGTAQAGLDFKSVTTTVWFSVCQRRVGTSGILIIDDLIVEDYEHYTVTLERTPSTPEFVTIDPVEATVEIVDAIDRARVELEIDQPSVDEGDSFEVAAVIVSPDIDCPVDFEFDIRLGSGLPTGARPYVSGIPSLVSFKRCNKNLPTSVSTSDMEATAELWFELGRTSDLDPRIAITRSAATAYVVDSGGTTQAFETLGAAGNNNPVGIWSDGTTMWVADTDDDKIYAYDLATKARDASKDFNTLAGAGNNNPEGIWSDRTTMWVVDQADDKIYAYDMATKARDADKEFNSLPGAGSGFPDHIWSDGSDHVGGGRYRGQALRLQPGE